MLLEGEVGHLIKRRSSRIISYWMLLIATLALFIFGLTFGFLKIEFHDVLLTILGKGTEQNTFTIMTLRMPRLLITVIMGMALAVSGSVLQTLTKNDLADPGILGINAGAGLGVTIAYLFLDFSSSNIVYALPIIGFVGALSTFLVTLFFSTDKGGRLNVDKLVLTGIGSAIALSGTMILFISSAGREDVQFIYRWLSGNIWGDKWMFVYITAPIVILLIILILVKSEVLNIMGLDVISAQSLGIDLKKERRYLILCSVALAAVVVSVAGSISFVGLIIPHISKRLYGPKHQFYMVGSILLGGLFLMGADILGRNIFLPQGLMPGIVVSLLGAPYFLYLIVKSNKASS